MKVERYEYGEDRDGRKGIMVEDVEMDGSDEENVDVASQIALAVIEDELDDLHSFTAVLIEIEHRNHAYCPEEGDFYDEVEVPHNFEVEPIDYMNLVIPMLLQTVEEEAEVNKWDYNEFAALLELEEKLINAEYQNELLSKLTAIVEPYRADWIREYKGEK